MSIQVTVQDGGVLRALRSMDKALRGQMRPVFQAVGAALEQNANMRFDLKEAPDGSPWKEWSPSTAAARAAEGRGTLLEYTGRMRDSLTYVADDKSVEVGFGVDYARYVNASRPLLLDGDQLGKVDRDDALKAAMKAFQKQLNLTGARP